MVCWMRQGGVLKGFMHGEVAVCVDLPSGLGRLALPEKRLLGPQSRL